jgi:hypothetical protein
MGGGRLGFFWAVGAGCAIGRAGGGGWWRRCGSRGRERRAGAVATTYQTSARLPLCQVRSHANDTRKGIGPAVAAAGTRARCFGTLAGLGGL